MVGISDLLKNRVLESSVTKERQTITEIPGEGSTMSNHSGLALIWFIDQMPAADVHTLSEVVVSSIVNQFEIVDRREQLQELLTLARVTQHRCRSHLAHVSTRSKHLQMLLNNLSPQFIVLRLRVRILIWRVGEDGGELHVWVGGNDVDLLVDISYTTAMTIATLPHSEVIGIDTTFQESSRVRTTGITEHVGAAHIFALINHAVK